VLYDDRRQVSPGVKFKDAELIGVPWIVVVGRGLADGVVELRNRRTGERTELPVGSAAGEIATLLDELSDAAGTQAPAPDNST
jgi:prolyl-tRNA synthetase